MGVVLGEEVWPHLGSPNFVPDFGPIDSGSLASKAWF